MNVRNERQYRIFHNWKYRYSKCEVRLMYPSPENGFLSLLCGARLQTATGNSLALKMVHQKHKLECILRKWSFLPSSCANNLIPFPHLGSICTILFLATRSKSMWIFGTRAVFSLTRRLLWIVSIREEVIIPLLLVRS